MKLPPLDITVARALAGAGAFFLSCVVLLMIFIKPELAETDLFKSLAQAIVIQGLIGLVFAFMFTGRNLGEGSNGLPPQPPAPPPATPDNAEGEG